jgi:hypothetical protein
MLDVPADAPPVLVALSLVSTALLGVALAGRPTPAPAAAPLAGTVDAVATADYAGVERRQIGASAVRIGPREIATRGPGGTSHATVAYGPVVPVCRGTRLWRVLYGTPPDDAFGGPLDLAAVADEARSRDAAWRHDPERLTVRRVTWRGVDVTLVGA